MGNAEMLCWIKIKMLSALQSQTTRAALSKAGWHEMLFGIVP